MTDKSEKLIGIMAVNLIEKPLLEAVQTGGTYAEFVVSKNAIAFICNGGSRKSTRHYRRQKTEIKADEELWTISEKVYYCPA